MNEFHETKIDAQDWRHSCEAGPACNAARTAPASAFPGVHAVHQPPAASISQGEGPQGAPPAESHAQPPPQGVVPEGGDGTDGACVTSPARSGWAPLLPPPPAPAWRPRLRTEPHGRSGQGSGQTPARPALPSGDRQRGCPCCSGRRNSADAQEPRACHGRQGPPPFRRGEGSLRCSGRYHGRLQGRGTAPHGTFWGFSRLPLM